MVGVRFQVVGSIVAAAVLLAGCGHQGTVSADTYRHSLGAACRRQAEFDRSLPELERDQHLSVVELRARVNQASESFRADVAQLTPPATLANAHRALVADLAGAPIGSTDPHAVARYASSLLDDYTALGVDDCEAFERHAIDAAGSIGRR